MRTSSIPLIDRQFILADPYSQGLINKIVVAGLPPLQYVAAQMIATTQHSQSTEIMLNDVAALLNFPMLASVADSERPHDLGGSHSRLYLPVLIAFALNRWSFAEGFAQDMDPETKKYANYLEDMAQGDSHSARYVHRLQAHHVFFNGNVEKLDAVQLLAESKKYMQHIVGALDVLSSVIEDRFYRGDGRGIELPIIKEMIHDANHPRWTGMTPEKLTWLNFFFPTMENRYTRILSMRKELPSLQSFLDYEYTEGIGLTNQVLLRMKSIVTRSVAQVAELYSRCGVGEGSNIREKTIYNKKIIMGYIPK